MGPCLFRHGNIVNVNTNTATTTFASMGPCLFRHGNLSQVLKNADLLGASMGPCLFRHGNPLH